MVGGGDRELSEGEKGFSEIGLSGVSEGGKHLVRRGGKEEKKESESAESSGRRKWNAHRKRGGEYIKGGGRKPCGEGKEENQMKFSSITCEVIDEKQHHFC